MWICNQVIGRGLSRLFTDNDLRSVWAAFAYHHDIQALEAVVNVFHVAWMPGEPCTVSVCLRPNANISTSLQAGIASAVLPRFGQADAIYEKANAWIREAAITAEPDRRAFLLERMQEWLIRCTTAYLTGMPLPQPRRRRQASKDRPTKEASAADAQETSPQIRLLDMLGNVVSVDFVLSEMFSNALRDPGGKRDEIKQRDVIAA